MKITLETQTIARILREAADTLEASQAQGMAAVQMDEDITLQNFLRFCLGSDPLKETSSPAWTGLEPAHIADDIDESEELE